MPSMMISEEYKGGVTTAAEAKRMCVIGNRMLAMAHIVDAFGHVSVRNPERPDTFYISWATSPEFVTQDDLQLCDFDGNILENGERRGYGERILHARIFKARPDVNAVCHGHPASLLPFICTDVPLRPVNAGGSIFYDGVPVLNEWDPESGLHIATIRAGDELAEVLGDKRAVLLRNHGMATVGEYVEQLVVVCTALAGCAESLARLLPLGVPINYLRESEARAAAESTLSAIGIERSWNFRLSKLKEAFPDIQ